MLDSYSVVIRLNLGSQIITFKCTRMQDCENYIAAREKIQRASKHI